MPSHKYLGFNLDQTLNFRMHVNTVIQVVSRKMYVFGKLRQFMSDKSASDVYKSMILPYFDYCDIIYSQTAAECLDKLQRLQNRGIRICLRSDPRSNVVAIHRSIKIPYLADRRELHLIVHMSSKRNCTDLINNRDVRTWLHDGLLFLLPKPRLNALRRSVGYAGAMLWNALPMELRAVDDPIVCKTLLKRILIRDVTNYN